MTREEHTCLMLTRFLRQALAVRHADDPTFRAEMRADIRRCIHTLRLNRALETS